MGKGDIKSKKGKILNGSYGVRRRRKKSNSYIPVVKEKTEKVKKIEVAEIKNEVLIETEVQETADKKTKAPVAKKKAPAAKKETTEETAPKAKKATSKKKE